MVLVLVVVGVVVVVLLVRLTKASETRARVAAVSLGVQIAHDLVDRLERGGGWRAAQANMRLIEWFDSVASELGTDPEDLACELRQPRSREFLAGLVDESWSRGVGCRFLELADFGSKIPSCPDLEPRADQWCTAQCDTYMEVEYLPPATTICPFCGSVAEPLNDVAASRVEWENAKAEWVRFERLFPDDAHRREAKESGERLTAAKFDAAQQTAYAAALVRCDVTAPK